MVLVSDGTTGILLEYTKTKKNQIRLVQNSKLHKQYSHTIFCIFKQVSGSDFVNTSRCGAEKNVVSKLVAVRTQQEF